MPDEFTMEGKIHRFQRVSASIFLLAAVFSQMAVAQDSANRKELKRTDLSGAPGMEVIMSVVEYQPGEKIPRHFHHGIETAYVLQGASLQKPGKPPRDVHAGTPIVNQRDVVHGGDTVVGNTPLKLLTVHIVDKGKALYEPARE